MLTADDANQDTSDLNDEGYRTTDGHLVPPPFTGPLTLEEKQIVGSYRGISPRDDQPFLDVFLDDRTYQVLYWDRAREYFKLGKYPIDDWMVGCDDKW